MKILSKRLLILLISVGLFQYFYTGTLKAKYTNRDGFEVIAHRGVSQTFHKNNLNNFTCTAARIYKPQHQYIENTIESISAAFNYGATVVEIDIRPTKDQQLVVFHDNRLECRTNARGHIRNYTVAQLKKLDIGFGYTHDNGKTYPFRGKGIAKLKTLLEVLRQFPNRKFLLDNKSGSNLKVAQLIVDVLSKLSIEHRRKIYLWCYDSVFDYIKQRVPEAQRLLLPRGRQKSFFIKYELTLGLTSLGEEYRNQGLALPVKYTKYLWAWPNRFLNKVYDGGAKFYLSINTLDDLSSIASIPLNGIITDHIELLGPKLEARTKK